MFADRCTQYAAAIAYRVLFSLFPPAHTTMTGCAC